MDFSNERMLCIVLNRNRLDESYKQYSIYCDEELYVLQQFAESILTGDLMKSLLVNISSAYVSVLR